MATFYGNIRGNRSETHRTGSRDSGILTAARSYLGSVTVSIWGDERKTGDHRATIQVAQRSEVGGLTLYRGDLSTLTNAEYLLPATEAVDATGCEALDVVIPNVGTVRLAFTENEDTGERDVSASILKGV